MGKFSRRAAVVTGIPHARMVWSLTGAGDTWARVRAAWTSENPTASSISDDLPPGSPGNAFFIGQKTNAFPAPTPNIDPSQFSWHGPVRTTDDSARSRSVCPRPAQSPTGRRRCSVVTGVLAMDVVHSVSPSHVSHPPTRRARVRRLDRRGRSILIIATVLAVVVNTSVAWAYWRLGRENGAISSSGSGLWCSATPVRVLRTPADSTKATTAHPFLAGACGQSAGPAHRKATAQ